MKLDAFEERIVVWALENLERDFKKLEGEAMVEGFKSEMRHDIDVCRSIRERIENNELSD